MATFALGAGNLFGVNYATGNTPSQGNSSTIYTVPAGFYARIFSIDLRYLSGASFAGSNPTRFFINRRITGDTNSLVEEDIFTYSWNTNILFGQDTPDVNGLVLPYFSGTTSTNFTLHRSAGDINGIHHPRLSLDEQDRVRISVQAGGSGNPIARYQMKYILYKKP